MRCKFGSAAYANGDQKLSANAAAEGRVEQEAASGASGGQKCSANVIAEEAFAWKRQLGMVVEEDRAGNIYRQRRS